MQFSGNVLSGKAALQYIQDKQSKKITTLLAPNVSPDADKSFLAELQSTDPARYQRLAKAQGILVQLDEQWVVGTCKCGQDIKDAPFVERGKDAGKGQGYCSRVCRDGIVPRMAGRPVGAKDRSSVVRQTKKHASSTDRVRAFRARLDVTQ